MDLVKLPGYTWVDGRVDGQFAALFPFQDGRVAPHIQLAHRRIMLPEQLTLGDPGRMVPYLRVSEDGTPLRVGGIDAPRDPAGEHKGYWEWHEESGWNLIVKGVIFDCPNPVVYLKDELIIANPSMGAMGIRYIEPDRRIVTADMTANSGTPWAAVCGVTGLNEWTQRGDITVGQGQGDNIVALYKNVRYVLVEGKYWFIRFARVGDRCVAAAPAMRMDHAAILLFSKEEIEGGAFRKEGSVSVPVPEIPPPPPPPKLRDKRFWLAPNIGSTDMLELFNDPEKSLKDVGVFQFYIQQILSIGPIGRNTYENLVAKDAFRKLKALGIAVAIECGAVKPGNCEAKDSIVNIEKAIRRVHEAGGVVTHVSMDEPLTAAKDGCPGQTRTVTASHTATFIKHVRNLGVKSVGWIEAWPEIDAPAHVAFLNDLRVMGALPSFLHLDVDFNRAGKELKSVASFIEQMETLCDLHRIDLGYIFHSTLDPIDSDLRWSANVRTLARLIHGMHPAFDHVITQSWTRRSPTGVQDVPSNLGSDGLVAVHRDLVTLFTTTPQPAPEPIPNPSGDKPVIYVDALTPEPPLQSLPCEVLDNGNGTISLGVPGRPEVRCLTPKAVWETRPLSSQGGPWETFVKGSTGLIAEREVEGGRKVFYTLFYVEVK